jgi:hypothetical protein
MGPLTKTQRPIPLRIRPLSIHGVEGRNRTTDTEIFSPHCSDEIIRLDDSNRNFASKEILQDKYIILHSVTSKSVKIVGDNVGDK